VVLFLNGGPPGLFNSASRSSRRVRSALRRAMSAHSATASWSMPARSEHSRQRAEPHGGGELQTRDPRHELARAAIFQTGSRSNLLLLAQAMGRPAPIRCAVVNSSDCPLGSTPILHRRWNRLERVLDLRAIGVPAEVPGQRRARRSSGSYGGAGDTRSRIPDHPDRDRAVASLRVQCGLRPAELLGDQTVSSTPTETSPASRPAT
jgi:hypothetical protein